LGRVFIHLGGRSDLRLGLGREEIANTGRETASDFDGLGLLRFLLK
jgi:hypothetical protein